MKAMFEEIEGRKGNHAFVAYRLTEPSFKFKWHYHPEFELTLITKGTGKRLVGDSYQNFEPGDLVLLGPGLPHTWVSNAVKKGQSVSAVVIQFSDTFIKSFLQFAEFKDIAALLSSASHGFTFASEGLDDEIIGLPEKPGVERVAALLLILQKLARLKPKKLASEYFRSIRGTENENRINTICQYLQKHGAEKIVLGKVSALIHLSPSAFCKFFKRATGKTFTDYVNDLRIGNACELLIESDRQINEIAYRVGFDSLTYFNRIFVRKKNMTPRRFRQQIRARRALTPI